MSKKAFITKQFNEYFYNKYKIDLYNENRQYITDRQRYRNTREPNQMRLVGRSIMEHYTNEVSAALGIPAEAIIGLSRKREILVARYMLISFFYKKYKFTLKNIGLFFCSRDHSSLCNAIASLQDMKDTKFSLYMEYNNVVGHILTVNDTAEKEELQEVQ